MFAFSRSSGERLSIWRYDSGDFVTYSKSFCGYNVVTDSVSLSKGDSSSLIKNTSFTAQVVVPNLLVVESKQGRAVPSGNVYMLPVRDTLV